MLVTVALLFGLLAPRAVYATNNIDQPELGSQVEGSAEGSSGERTDQEKPGSPVSSDEENSSDADDARESQDSGGSPDLTNKQN